ncbi:Dynein intermediate chain 2, ciliary [Balamuthia mandrillaris]
MDSFHQGGDGPLLAPPLWRAQLLGQQDQRVPGAVGPPPARAQEVGAAGAGAGPCCRGGWFHARRPSPLPLQTQEKPTPIAQYSTKGGSSGAGTQQHERTVVSSQKKARTNATAITTTATARATSSMSSNSTGGIATPLLELEEEKEERQKEEARRHLEASLALDDSQNQPLSFSNHQDKLATTAQQPAEAEEGEEEETGLSLLSAYDD